jgi:glycolate oxidase FAD binding subunit
MTVADMVETIAPSDEAGVAAAVADAASRGRKLRIEGGGSRAGLGRPVEADAVLSTAALSGVSLYEPAALTLVAGAGARVDDITAMLAAEGQRLPFEPLDHAVLYGLDARGTLGGMVATNASGPRRIQAGACRDSLIGVRFVDGAGTVIKNGGRVMKNVTGYDLVKLLAGSHGTLGVLTEVAFKLLPMPETEATLVIDGHDPAAAVAAMAAAMGSPYDVSGAAHMAGRTMLRVEGFAASVAHRRDGLIQRLRGHGAVDVLTDEASARTWRDVTAACGLASKPGALWRLSMKPSDAPPLLDRLGAEGIIEDAALDWAGGLVWLRAPEEGDAGASAIRGLLRQGHATLIRARAEIRASVPPFHPEPAPLAALSTGIRARFNLGEALNPGRMVG